MEVEPVVEELEDESTDHDEEDAIFYIRRPQHEQCLAEVFRLNSDELIDRLSIDRFDRPGFVPAEVVVTLARSGFGSGPRVRRAIAEALNRCVLKELRFFIKSNANWYSVIKRTSEEEVEAVADIRSSIFTSKHEISFAEVSFRVFADKRLRSWFKAQARWKNSMPSVDSFTASDADGPSLIEQIEDDSKSRPEELFARKQLVERCLVAVARLPAQQRIALTLHVLQDITYKEAGELMQLDESSVRYHVKSALKALQGGNWYE